MLVMYMTLAGSFLTAAMVTPFVVLSQPHKRYTHTEEKRLVTPFLICSLLAVLGALFVLLSFLEAKKEW